MLYYWKWSKSTFSLKLFAFFTLISDFLFVWKSLKDVIILKLSLRAIVLYDNLDMRISWSELRLNLGHFLAIETNTNTNTHINTHNWPFKKCAQNVFCIKNKGRHVLKITDRSKCSFSTIKIYNDTKTPETSKACGTRWKSDTQADVN